MQFLNISLKLILLQQKRKKEKMNKKEQAFSWDYSSVASEYWGRGGRTEFTMDKKSELCTLQSEQELTGVKLLLLPLTSRKHHLKDQW